MFGPLHDLGGLTSTVCGSLLGGYIGAISGVPAAVSPAVCATVVCPSCPASAQCWTFSAGFWTGAAAASLAAAALLWSTQQCHAWGQGRIAAHGAAGASFGDGAASGQEIGPSVRVAARSVGLVPAVPALGGGARHRPRSSVSSADSEIEVWRPRRRSQA